MYKFKLTKEERLKLFDGRTTTYYANKIGVTVPNLTAVLTGHRTCNRMTAYCICKAISPDLEVDDLFIKLK